MQNGLVIPYAFLRVISELILSHHFEIRRAVHEGDELICEMILKNEITAVVSSDSDFLVSNVKYVIPVNEFDRFVFRSLSQFTKDKLSNAESIILQSDPTGLLDSNGRYLGYVWYRTNSTDDYRCLNLELIEQGYSPAKGMSGALYMQEFYDAGTRAQAFKDRTNGEDDPTFDYSANGQKYTIKQILETFGTPEAIASEEFKGTKVYIEGLVTRKLGISSAYIEQVDNGYYTTDEDGNETCYVNSWTAPFQFTGS